MNRHILHVIPGLHVGGAEAMLYDTVVGLPTPHWTHTICNLQPTGSMTAALTAAGARVIPGTMRPGRPTPAGLWALARHIRQLRPNIIQGWMYAGNLAALAAARLAGYNGRVAWNVHSDAPQWPGMSPSQRATCWLNAKASPRVQRIWYVAYSSARAHAAAGFAMPRADVVSPGIDLAQFAPAAPARMALRQRLGVGAEVPLVGIVARPHPMKAHEIFFQAAAQAAAHPISGVPLHFVVVGEGLQEAPPGWAAHIAPSLGKRLHWLGAQADVAPILQGLDVCTLSSNQEALPKIVLEAMACATLCVTTAVGDCPALLADVGWTVPVRDPRALAAAWGEALSCPALARQARLARGQRRIEATYTAEHFAETLSGLYRSMPPIARP